MDWRRLPHKNGDAICCWRMGGEGDAAVMPSCGGKLRQHHAGHRDMKGCTTGIRWHKRVVQETAPKASGSKWALVKGTFFG